MIYTEPGRSHTEFTDATYIPVVSLTEETTTPFLTFRGKLLEEDSLMSVRERSLYRASVKRFPNARACLTDTSSNPDIRTIDWEKIQFTSDFDVCLFRIFSSIGNAIGAHQWLSFHGYRSQIDDQKYFYPHGKMVFGKLPGKDIPFGGRTDRFNWKLFDLFDLSVSAEFNPEGNLLKVRTSVSSDDLL